MKTYPELPGFKERDGTTSRDAAHAVDLKDRDKVFGQIMAVLKVQPSTADEVAGKLSRSVLYIRPRFTELKEVGAIEKTGARRRNASGQSAAVWRVVVKEEQVELPIGG
jgi:predicted ArsR family transcriptional regulator